MALRIVRYIHENGVRLGVYDFDATVLGKRERKRVSAPTKEAAQAIFKQWLETLATGTREHKLFEKLNEYLEYSKEHKSPRMADEERRHVALFQEYFSDMPLSEFRRHTAEDYICWRKDHRVNGAKAVNPATINRDLSTLRYFFGWCIQREYFTAHNPIYKLHKSEKENERIVWLTAEQKQEIYDKASDFQRRFLNIALLTGMRQSEIASLRWGQVDLKNGLIQLFKTKSKRKRTIRIPKALTDYLCMIREQEPFFHDVLNRNGEPIECATLDKSWRCLRRRLSFQATNGTKLRFHDLRHAYACDALMQGMTKEELQIQLGHSSVLMTEKYARYIGDIPASKVDGMTIPSPLQVVKMA
ncbi:MAG: site-specific integrase [Spirochaetota bacterium]